MAWAIDTTHSQIEFSVRHMMISKVRGRFESFSGVVELDEQNPTAARVDISVDISSVDTRDEKRDGHLKSPEFFDAASFPSMQSVSTRVEQTDDTHAKIHGDLSIRGVTRPVVLDAEFQGKAKSPWGTTSAGFNASTVINREDWGLTWNVGLETGGVLVGKEVTIEIEAELIEQVETATAAEPVAV
ncbi:MAG: YceI family protein [Roseiflexaceae bacterium]|nr:YceI family protein [Roseiflexaceae bacterium]